MKDEALLLQNQLCFPLYACAKEIVKQYGPFLKEIGLTYTQYIVMLVLWEQKAMNVKALGERLYLDSGTLTPLLKKLEAEGFITRDRMAKDERNVQIALTAKAETLKKQALDIPAKISSCVKLSMQDAATLYRLLYQILEGLRT